jgi:hypothetical protein
MCPHNLETADPTIEIQAVLESAHQEPRPIGQGLLVDCSS